MAVWTPMARLDAPTPLVAIATAGYSRQLGVGLGHKRGARLVAGRDQGQIGVPLGGVQNLQEALAGHGVQPPDTGPRQNLGRDVTRLYRRHVRHPTSECSGVGRNRLVITPYILHPRTFQRSRNDASGNIVCWTRRSLVRTDVMVVGCGVIGLTAAISLREAGLDANIVTAELPQATTSSVAAAIWYPYKAYPEDRVLSWGRRTYEMLRGALRRSGDRRSHARGRGDLARAGPRPLVGRRGPPLPSLHKDELPPGYSDGHAFVAPVVEMPVYLSYLMDRFAASGGSVHQRTLASLDEVPAEARVVVNCAGLGARDLVGDTSMNPIRGQIVRVRNPGLERFVLDEDNPEGVTYMSPARTTASSAEPPTRANGTSNPTQRPPKTSCAAATRSSRASRTPRCWSTRWASDPAARGTPGRGEDPAAVPIIHNYGHGGSGITLSWGCAEETLGLVREALDGQSVPVEA